MSTEGLDVDGAVRKMGLTRMKDGDIRDIIAQIVALYRNLDPWEPEKKFRYLMGLLMIELRGRVPGERVATFLKDALETRP